MSLGSDDVIATNNPTATTKMGQIVVIKFVIDVGFNTIITIGITSVSPPPTAIVRRKRSALYTGTLIQKHRLQEVRDLVVI